MDLTDCRGVPVSTRNRASLDRYEAAVELLHGYYGDPLAAIDQALTEDPAFVMGHCLRAALMITTTDRNAEIALRQSFDNATALLNIANDRERRHISAARAWLDGDFAGSIQRYGEIVIEYPRDSLALQVAHIGDFYLGQSTMLRDRVAQVLPEWGVNVPGMGYVLGMHAFGLEETHSYRRAEDTAQCALNLNPRDPWAIHAAAHVMEMEGRLVEGVKWLTTRSGDWAVDNAFAFHNWWHLALFHLDLGELDRVLEIYDRGIRPKSSDVLLEMVDASAMLWRLQLRDVDVGDRWKELAKAWQPTVEQGYYVFNDMHAVMALASSGGFDREIAQLWETLRRRATGHDTNAKMIREVGLSACRAMLAFVQGEYAKSTELLLPILPIAQRFGGSHAQRDVLHLTAVEAALRSNQGRLARALVAQRTDLKPTNPFNGILAVRVQKARVQ